jgi:hypothetical protein
MYELLSWLEQTPLADALRGAGVWVYGWINLAHILGIGALFGAILILDLRLLGGFRRAPLWAIMQTTVPVAAVGAGVAIVSGVALISFNAIEYHGNPYLYLKLPLIGLGLLNAALVPRLGAWRRAAANVAPAPRDRVTLAGAGLLSLVTWLLVVGCGRMIGYW